MQHTIKSRNRINRIEITVKLTNHSVLCYIKNSLKVSEGSVSSQFPIVSGRLLNSFDALSWKVLFLVGTTKFLAAFLFYYFKIIRPSLSIMQSFKA